MNTPPANADLDPQDIAQALAWHWEVNVRSMSYLAVGFGSHHWLAELAGSGDQSLFVTADRIGSDESSREHLRRALDTAWHLRHGAGIEAVVAPIRTPAGEVLVPVNDEWVVALYPHLDLEQSAWGPFGTAEDCDRAQQLVARIHSVDTSTLLSNPPPREDFAIPYRDELFERLASIDGSWSMGPYAAPARLQLERHAELIRAGFARYDALVALAEASHAPWVITHGEPHAGNIVWRADRQDMVVVDWDTCAVAPRERDLWQLSPPNDTTIAGFRAYLETVGKSEAEVSIDLLALYRLRWDLSEIAIYADQFFHEHDESEDSRVAWGGFTSSVEMLDRHLHQGDGPIEPGGDFRHGRR